MTKVYNGKLANTEVVFSFGTVLFDPKGVADIQPDENAELVLGVEGFIEVDAELAEKLGVSSDPVASINVIEDDKVEVKSVQATEPETKQDPIVPEGIAKAVEEADRKRDEKIESANEDMTHDELDELAKSINVKFERGVKTKADKVKAIRKSVE